MYQLSRQKIYFRYKITQKEKMEEYRSLYDVL
jgi:hypothetical protein